MRNEAVRDPPEDSWQPQVSPVAISLEAGQECENRLPGRRVRVAGSLVGGRTPAPSPHRPKLARVQPPVRFTPIYGNRNSKKHWPPITAPGERAGASTERLRSIRITGPAIPRPSSPDTLPHLQLPSSPASNSPAPFPSRFLHRSQKATTKFGLREHLGGGHNESGSRQAGPIGRRRVGAVEAAPARSSEERKPRGGGQ